MLNTSIRIIAHESKRVSHFRGVSNVKNVGGSKSKTLEMERNFTEYLSSFDAKQHDWEKVRKEILNTVYNSPQTIDVRMIKYWIQHKKYDLAYSYIQYIKNGNFPLNLALIGKYFALQYHMQSENLLHKVDEDIISMYEELKRKYDVLDSITLENVILGLSVTNNWKECVKLLHEIKTVCASPNSLPYSAVVAAAFNNNENDLGWELLHKIVESGKAPTHTAYFSILRQVSNTNKSLELENLFKFFAHNDIITDKEVAVGVTETMNKLNRNSCRDVNMIYRKGICKNCKNKLQKIELTKEEFTHLQTNFFKNVIIGKNVFYKTTPIELDNFKQFVTHIGEYNVIIDGLNVAYSAGTKQNPQVYTMMICSVVRHFKQLGKKVLVVGRKHMEKWPNWFHVEGEATTFLISNLSHDDPYLLYCALKSGANTSIVSRDMMRSHLYLLDDVHHKTLFKRWLAQNVYYPLRLTQQSAIFKEPLSYMVTAQKIKNYWHMPYYDGSTSKSGEPIVQWLCLKL